MYKLTPDQQVKLNRRRAGFDQFLEERLTVLLDFCDHLQLEEPYQVLNEAELFLAPIDEWLAYQDLHDRADENDRIWLATRLGYFVGELLVQRFHGCWFVEDNPDGRYFANYVVGQFSLFPNARVDPLLAVKELIDKPGGRRLSVIVDEISSELIDMATKDQAQ